MSATPDKSHASRQRRIERRQLSAAALALLALAVVAVFVFLVEGKIGRSGYTVRGVFASANGIELGSPVRIAGVDVGQVSGISTGPGNTTVVSMNIDSSGQPIHADATLSILPRLILEGSFYVSLDPGTPGARELPGGATVPESHTSVPVQFDQFLDTFTLPTRQGLSDTFKGFAQGLGGGGANLAPPGYVGFRSVIRSLEDGLPSMSAAAQASLGTEVNDLHRTIVSTRDFTTQLAESPQSLAALTTHFNELMGDLATENQPLAATVANLDGLLRSAPPDLAALDHALPVVRQFGQALDPALRATPGPLAVGMQLNQQLQAMSSPTELPALLNQTEPASATLPQLESRLEPLVKLVTPADECLSGHVAWTLDQKLQDGSLSTGDPAWLDILHSFTAITSVTGGFDGNGSAVREGIVGSASELQGVLPELGTFAGLGPTIKGVRPTWLGYGVEPPYRPDQWCYQQPRPNLVAPAGPPPVWATDVVTNPLAKRR